MAKKKSIISTIIKEVERSRRRKLQHAAKVQREWIAAERRADKERIAEANRARRKADLLHQQKAREAERLVQQQDAARRRKQRTEEVEVERNDRREAAATEREAVASRAEARQAEATRRSGEAIERLELLRSIHRSPNPRMVGSRQMLSQTLKSFGRGAYTVGLRDVLNDWTMQPAGTGRIIQIGFNAQLQEAIVEFEFPSRAILPEVKSVKYVKSRDELVTTNLQSDDLRRAYLELLPSLTLRVLRDVFDATDPDVVNDVIFNGFVVDVDSSTGNAVRPCVLSVGVARSSFAALNLEAPEFKPIRCLRGPLKAIVSPHPYDLEPVLPILEFDLSRYKFVDAVDVLAGIDSRLDVLALTPTGFEHLVRDLVEKMGMRAWTTQASNDDGVDAVAVNETPLIGGKCIIQAKKYKGLVSFESILALAGAIEQHKAARGILMTTSWVGRKGHEFAKQHGRMDIYEGREMKALLLEHLNRDALFALPVRPQHWDDADVA